MLMVEMYDSNRSINEEKDCERNYRIEMDRTRLNDGLMMKQMKMLKMPMTKVMKRNGTGISIVFVVNDWAMVVTMTMMEKVEIDVVDQ